MTAYEVRSINPHRAVEITRHFTPAWVRFEMDCRALCGHSAIQSRAVELEPHPWGCERKPKPGRVAAAGGGV